MSIPLHLNSSFSSEEDKNCLQELLELSPLQYKQENCKNLITEISNILHEDLQLKDLNIGNCRFKQFFSKEKKTNNISIEVFSETPKESLNLCLKAIKQRLTNLKLEQAESSLSFINNLIKNRSAPDSFHVLNISQIVQRFHLWRNNFSEVMPFYAVKSNPEPTVIQALAVLGIGFDCASENEMKLVSSFNVDPERIIFANTRKFESDIYYAKSLGVEKMTFDSEDELEKMLKIFPKAKLVLRIKTNDASSTIKLSSKFGCRISKAKTLMKLCYEKGANLIGISFHVGINNPDPEAYINALSDAALLIKEANDIYNKKMSFLDLGGGWPGIDDSMFVRITERIKVYLKENFQDDIISIIAEPGRFYSNKLETLVTKIIGVDENDETVGECTKKLYYVSNGVYQSFFNSIYFAFDEDLIKSEGLELNPISERKDFNPLETYPSLVYGPSCDSADKILNCCILPQMKRGDFLYSENLGSYANVFSGKFNGIKESQPFYFYSEL